MIKIYNDRILLESEEKAQKLASIGFGADFEGKTSGPLFCELLAKSVDAQVLTDGPKGCLDCGGIISPVTTISETFGKITCYPSRCEVCRQLQYAKFQDEEIKKVFEIKKIRCAGIQNKQILHNRIAIRYENIKLGYDQQSAFINYLGEVLDGKEFCGAYVYGPTGTGKTFLSKLLHNELLARFRDSCFVKAVDLALIMRRETFGDRYKEVLHDFQTVETLIIDDFGTQKNTDFVKETIFSVFDYRYENDKRTIITSNLTADDLEEMDSRLSSRFRDRGWMRHIFLQGRDFRLIH